MYYVEYCVEVLRDYARCATTVFEMEYIGQKQNIIDHPSRLARVKLIESILRDLVEHTMVKELQDSARALRTRH